MTAQAPIETAHRLVGDGKGLPAMRSKTVRACQGGLRMCRVVRTE